MGNIFSGNTIVNNSVGIEVDRSSRSNTFYLNYLDNPREVDTQSADNIWSGRQVYQYSGPIFPDRWEISGKDMKVLTAMATG